MLCSKNSLPSTLRDIRLRRDKQTVEEELNRRIEQLTKQIKYQLEKLKILIKPRSSASDIYSGILSSSTDALTLLSQKVDQSLFMVYLIKNSVLIWFELTCLYGEVKRIYLR